MKNSLRGSAVAALLCIALGCAPLTAHRHQDQELANALFQQKKYAEAAEQYRKLLTPQSASESDAAARYSLGVLYAYHDNPHRDYNQAVEAFDDFIRRYPHHERAAEAENWRSTIKLIQEEAKEKDQLKKSIEQLKRLDIRHEEKRKER